MILERGNRLIKSPSHWVKPYIQEQLEIPLPELQRTTPDPPNIHNNDRQKNHQDLCAQASGSLPSQVVTTHSQKADSHTHAPVNRMPWKRYNLRSSRNTQFCSDSMLDFDLLAFISCDSNVFVSSLEPTTGTVSSNDTDNKPIMEGDKSMPINSSALFGEFGAFDLGRIPHRIFLRIDAGRLPNREEIMGLLTMGKNGIPIAKLRNALDFEVKKMTKIHTTMVVKIKPSKGFKARLCLRGDQQSLEHSAFVSAPNTARDSMRFLIIFLQGDSARKLGSVDISKAFAQSDYLHPQERLFDWLPEYVGLLNEKWR